MILCCLGGARSIAALTDTAEDGGAGEWSISLSVPEAAEESPVLTLNLVGELPPEAHPAAAAVCITVDLPEGWRVIRAEPTDGAPTSLTVTTSAVGARAVILADGTLENLVGLRIFIAADAADTPNGALVTAACPEGIAFFSHATGGVERIPVRGASVAIPPDGGTGQATQPPTDEESEAADSPDSPEEETNPPAAVLIGCQETPCTGGIFSIRFIYKIEDGEGTPADTGVVCLAGQGVISAEVTFADSVTEWTVDTPSVTVAEDGAHFLLVTLRGLSAQGAWVFQAERGDGQRALARWKNGQFSGWQDG
jgi:hypothetical protein